VKKKIIFFLGIYQCIRRAGEKKTTINQKKIIEIDFCIKKDCIFAADFKN
jgi:hypothetical protein